MRDWLTIRNGLGVVMLVMFFRIATSGLAGYGGYGMAILSMCFLILAGILFSSTLSDWFSRPFTKIVDGIYFGNNQAESPPVSLRLARIYRQELRYEDAISECERQLEYHPRSLELWTELIRSAQESGDGNLTQRFHRKALRRLRGEDRERLDQEISQPGARHRHGECKAMR